MFAGISNLAIVSLNASLLVNTVGFYQVRHVNELNAVQQTEAGHLSGAVQYAWLSSHALRCLAVS